MNLAERKKKLRQTGYWCSLEISGIGFVAVFFVLLVVTMYAPLMSTGGKPVDLANTLHPTDMQGALREDAMELSVQRDGTIYFGLDRVTQDEIAGRISEMLGAGSERKVYVRADKRVKFGAVVQVIDAVRESGVERIAFITEVPSPRITQ